jgi:hypothetical protein
MIDEFDEETAGSLDIENEDDLKEIENEIISNRANALLSSNASESEYNAAANGQRIVNNSNSESNLSSQGKYYGCR